MLVLEQVTLCYLFKLISPILEGYILRYDLFLGILSIFCAQAGAQKVYAIEASDLVKLTEKVLIENKLQNKITVIHSKVEEIDVNNFEKVDVIISEWMGFYLVHEGMLDTVLFARDNFLKENGILFPSIAKLYASPCQLPSIYNFWDNVYGVTMK